MIKRVLWVTAAVFLSWLLIGFIIHVPLLSGSYAATRQLWRPRGEMKMWLTYLNMLLGALVFVFVYSQFITGKSVRRAMQYGLLFGLAVAFPMSMGTFAAMPIPLPITLVWLGGTVVEHLVAGLLVGFFIPPTTEE
jgi:hypothetical protein